LSSSPISPSGGIFPEKGKKKKSRVREWTEAVLVAFIAVMIFRTFFFEAFTIPSSSMEKSLLQGDYIIVSKLHYGARLPITPLSVPFFHQRLSEHIKSYLDWIHFPYMRSPGFSEIKINDVVVFNAPADPDEQKFPVDERTYYIKRCMGRAGDTFELRNACVYINGQEIPLPAKAETEYVVKTDTSGLDFVELRALQVSDINSIPVAGHYLIEMTPEAADSIRKWKHVLSVSINAPLAGQKDPALFPFSKEFNWNLDNFGSFRIPRKGMTITLCPDSLPLYGKIITDYEHNKLEVSHDSVFLNGHPATTYTFRMNYYFMMGDNRHYSQDSRYWGFVPEDHIVGKAVLILTSIDRQNKHWRWDRLLTRVR
jgi:signal peptidase I